MPLEIVPGKPEKLRMLWQAYTWVLIATLVRHPVLPHARRAAARPRWRKTLRRVPRPAFAAAIFFAIAYVLNHSGKAPAMVDGQGAPGPWTGRRAQHGAGGGRRLRRRPARQAYAGVAAFLGLLGGFISGSETSSIAMLTKLHFDTIAQVFAGAEPGARCYASPAGRGGERHRRRAGRR